MKLARLCIVSAAAALASAPAMAETSRLVSPSYIGILGGYTFADDDRGGEDLDYATGVQLLYGSLFEDSQ